jgi:type 1 glutamine amidotransferase
MKLGIFSMVFLYFLTGYSQNQSAEKKVDNTKPTEAEIVKIYDAVPAQPSVQPLKPRKLLVFSLAWGYKHSAAPWGKKAFEAMAEKTKAFDVVVSDDVSMFESENLKQFDAIVFNNTNEEIFLPENYKELPEDDQAKAGIKDKILKKSLVEFLKGGKGLAVIHAGVASFREWPEFGNIIGARFDNHPWNAGSTITLKVEDPGHPLVRAFTNEHFKVTDEIYQFKGDYSRDNVRVLISIDTSRTNMKVKNIHRTDGDFAMSWIKDYGKGRIFYNAFGHENHIFWDPVILRHLLDGIQFVLGDLACDTTPSAKIQIK